MPLGPHQFWVGCWVPVKARARAPHGTTAQGVDPAGVRTDTGLRATHAQAQSPPQLRQSMERSQLASRVTTIAAPAAHRWLQPAATPTKRDEKGNKYAWVPAQEEEWWASGVDLAGVRTDKGLCVTHVLMPPPARGEGKALMGTRTPAGLAGLPGHSRAACCS
jgi:hypothetical protein